MYCFVLSFSSGIDILGFIEFVYIKKGVEESCLILSYMLKRLKIKCCIELF